MCLLVGDNLGKKCQEVFDTNFENGKMRGPGGSSVIEKLNTKGCVFSFDLGVLVVPGYYQCGTVLPAEKNGTEYALFAAFNVSIPEAMKSRERHRVGVPTPTISITTQRDVEGHTTIPLPGVRKIQGSPLYG